MDQPKPFRNCLGKFTTGVTVITCSDDDGRPYGITVNSFSSVSLEPRLILYNIAKVSNSLQAFLESPQFAINILARDQEQLSAHFAMSDHTLFDSVEVERSQDNVPLIPGTLACFECSTYEVHECGDHYIVVGKVDRFTSRDAEPLVFFGGKYRSLEITEAG